MKKYIVIALIVFLPILSVFRTDGFIIDKIYSRFPWEKSWEVANKQDIETIQQILDQPYFYLDCGRQCFVFKSKDDKWVIKFINHERFFFPKILSGIYLPEFLDRLRSKKIKVRKTVDLNLLYAIMHLPTRSK